MIFKNSFFTILVFVFAVPFLRSEQTPIFISGPDNKIAVIVSVNDAGRLVYTVQHKNKTVLLPCCLGISVEGDDLGTNAHFGTTSFSEVNETYPSRGIHSQATNHYKGVSIPVTGGSNASNWTLEMRVFNDGLAFRYRVPGKGLRKINSESTTWVLPRSSVVWWQDNIKCYEGLFFKSQIDQLTPQKLIGSPITVELPDRGGYIVVSEANLVNYSDMALRVAPDRSLSAYFHANKAGWNADGEITSPWRVTMVADDLNTLVNSDIHRNLCPPPEKELVAAKWIAPGRAAWQWWSVGRPKYNEQRKWVDWTNQLGFEYYLVDDGWKIWKDANKDQWACLKRVVDYARSQNVKVLIWVHSQEVFKPKDRAEYFSTAKKAGVSGLKIDFPPAARLEWVNWYEDVLRDAAALHLTIDFHGAVKPSGRDRTWPNELTREAIRGHEWHLLRYKRTQPPEHDTVLPFTRFLVGPGDYTPTAFNPKELCGYTWARELAQAIVFTSPLLCYADRPDFYLQNKAVEMIKAIPSVWDETVVLPGSRIGSVAAFARRSGKQWFIGVINGAEPVDLKFPLTFLENGTYNISEWGDPANRDDGWDHKVTRSNRNDILNISLRKQGGYVARISPSQ